MLLDVATTDTLSNLITGFGVVGVLIWVVYYFRGEVNSHKDEVRGLNSVNTALQESFRNHVIEDGQKQLIAIEHSMNVLSDLNETLEAMKGTINENSEEVKQGIQKCSDSIEIVRDDLKKFHKEITSRP